MIIFPKLPREVISIPRIGNFSHSSVSSLSPRYRASYNYRIIVIATILSRASDRRVRVRVRARARASECSRCNRVQGCAAHSAAAFTTFLLTCRKRHRTASRPHSAPRGDVHCKSATESRTCPGIFCRGNNSCRDLRNREIHETLRS